MNKVILYVLGLAIGLACFYFIFRRPDPLTVDYVQSISSPSELEKLYDIKCREMARILKQISNESSAAQHRPAAQYVLIQMEMLRARAQWLPSPPSEGLHPYADRFSGMNELRPEVKRLRSLSWGRKELGTVLEPVHAQLSLFPGASHVAPEIVLVDCLKTLREQFALYREQHAGLLPDLRTHGWKILLQRTTRSGRFEATKADTYATQQMVGPYLLWEIENPVTRSSKIFFITGDPWPNFKAPGYGYVYDNTRGIIWGINSDGKIFNESTPAADAR